MADILNIINWLYNELIPLSPMKQEYQQKLDKKFRLEFNYNSNHLEGNTLTYGETELLLIFGQTKGNHDKQEYDEMEAHDVAYKKIIEWATDRERPLTEMDIKNLNEVILVRPFWKEAITPDGQPTKRQIKIGSYKEFPNSVQLQNGEIFYYTSPSETPIQMGELIEWYRNEEEKKELHPVTLAAMLHYRFVRIHPFDDGNGRISRLLVNYVLLRNYFPPIIIKSADKKNYLNALHQADAGFLEEFVNYIAEQVKWSFEISIKAAKGESIDEDDDFLKEIQLLKRKITDKSYPNKSPNLVYNVYTVIATKVWPTIDNTLKYFDSLFSESRTIHLLNFLPEDFGTILSSHSLVRNFEKKEDPSIKKIFGYNIYDREVNSFTWKQTIYGLRGSNKKSDFEISLSIILKQNEYKTELTVNFSVIANYTKTYLDEFQSDEVKKLNDYLKKHLIDEIKKELNSDFQ